MADIKQWILKSHPTSDKVSQSNFEMRSVAKPDVGAGEFGIQTIALTVSPPVVVWARSEPLGQVFTGTGIGRVVDSKHPGFANGDLVAGRIGWTQYAVSNGATRLPVSKFQQRNGLPLTTRLHVLGSTGATAYFALLETGRARLGETILVSAAAGSVGSIVVQLARMAGCHVVGIAGSDKKCAWIKELGAHQAINYKTDDIARKIAEYCPNGIDLYFDNVGGETLTAALNNMAKFGRILLCGATTQYDQQGAWQAPANYFNLVPKGASMLGFHINYFMSRLDEAAAKLAPMIASGQLKYAEDVLEGVENLPNGLVRMMSSQNFGTQVIRIAD
jgi:NADPH-dependent curcumin reductase CurA